MSAATDRYIGELEEENAELRRRYSALIEHLGPEHAAGEREYLAGLPGGVPVALLRNDRVDARIGVVGRRVRQLRRQKGLTQQQLANQAGCSRSQVNKLEMAQHTPTARLLVRLAAGLGVDPLELWIVPAAEREGKK